MVIDNKRQIYVDHSAGRPVDSRVIDIMLPYLKKSYGNPSSLHRFGQEAKQALDNSRENIAKLINAEKSETIIFTSGATESNNLAIKGLAIRNRKKGTLPYTLNLKLMISLSWTGYSLLSNRNRPFSLALAKEPHCTKSL